MATGNALAGLRRRRGYYAGQIARLSKKLDEFEQSGCPREDDLIHIRNRLETYETEFHAIQIELVGIDEEEIARGLEITDECEKLELRVIKQLNNIRPSTPSTPKCSGNLSNHFQRSIPDSNKTSNATHSLPTENIVLNLSSISSQDMRYSLHDTRSSSPTRDLKTIPHGSLNRKERNPVQDNNGHTPPTESIASNLAPIPSHDIASRSSHDTHNVSPTRDPTTTSFTSSASQQSDSTPSDASNQTIAQDSLDQQKDDTLPDDLLSPTTLSPKWATPTSGLKQYPIPVDFIAAHKVDHLINLDGFQNSPSDLNIRTQTPQSATPNKPRTTDFSLKSPLAAATPLYSPMAKRVPITTPNASTLPRSIIKKARYGWVSGGSPAPQSTIDLLHASTTHLHVNFTCLCEIDEMYNDTSWAEVFHDTSWAELFHDTSWFVNFDWKSLGNDEEDSDREYKEDNISSTHCLSAVSSNSPWRLIGLIRTTSNRQGLGRQLQLSLPVQKF